VACQNAVLTALNLSKYHFYWGCI